MRIAFIVRSFPLLSETFILNQITGLIDLGHEVDIFAMTPSQDAEVHPDVIDYGLLERTRYIGLPKNRAIRYLKGAMLFSKSVIERPSLVLNAVRRLVFEKSSGSLRSLYLATYFKKKYAIAHCHFGPLGSIGVDLKKIGAPLQRVVTAFHGFDITVYLNRMENGVYADLFKHGDLFLPISDNWKNRLVELGCPPEKIAIQRMGVDCGRFDYRPRSIKAGEAIRLISIARLVEKKGLEYSIKAVGRLKREFPALKYTIIGDGPLREALQQEIRNQDCEGIIEITGWKTHDEVQCYLNAAHILVVPSITSAEGDQEGIPVVLMEAMAMGLPVVATQHSGIPELVRDGTSGYLVPEKDIEVLYRKLKSMMQHPGHWPGMGKQGRICVEQHYNVAILNRRLISIYNQLLTKKYAIELDRC